MADEKTLPVGKPPEKATVRMKDVPSESIAEKHFTSCDGRHIGFDSKGNLLGKRFVDIVPSLQVVGEGENRKNVPKVVRVSKESDLTDELIFKGPENERGIVRYVTVDKQNLRFDRKTGILLGLLLALLVSFFAVPPSALAQGVGRTRVKIAATEAPFVTRDGVSATYGPATLLKVNYTVGKVYLGDTPVSVAAGQLTMTASKADCTGPAYAACNIVYANSSGTVASTLAIGTAAASGNSVLAYVQTSSTAVTEIRYPWETTLGDPAVSTASTIFASATNCADGTASPADCGAAPAGAVIISASATAVVVNTTAVTDNSEIFLQEDSSLGTRLSVTCNTTTGRDYTVSARTAATSFTITASAAPTTNPACLSYLVVN